MELNFLSFEIFKIESTANGDQLFKYPMISTYSIKYPYDLKIICLVKQEKTNALPTSSDKPHTKCCPAHLLCHLKI